MMLVALKKAEVSRHMKVFTKMLMIYEMRRETCIEQLSL